MLYYMHVQGTVQLYYQWTSTNYVVLCAHTGYSRYTCSRSSYMELTFSLHVISLRLFLCYRALFNFFSYFGLVFTYGITLNINHNSYNVVVDNHTIGNLFHDAV